MILIVYNETLRNESFATPKEIAKHGVCEHSLPFTSNTNSHPETLQTSS